MSAQPEVAVPPMNDQQATAILQEALNRQMMDGVMPSDEATRLSYAQHFVGQAKQALAAGNQGEDVMQILFIAEADQQPAPVPVAAPPVAAPPVAAPSPPATAPTAEANFDFESLSDETLANMISTLNSPQYSGMASVQAEITALENEQTRRAGGQIAQAAKPQAVPPPAQASPAPISGTVPAQVGTPPAPPAPVATPDANQAPAPIPPGQALPPGIGDPQGAGVPPGFPPPSGNVAESVNAAQVTPADQPATDQVPQDGERTALEAQLTVGSLRAHNIEITEVPNLPIESLRTVVENPGGPVASTTTPTMAPSDAPAASIEREQLVSQITGPMLKAYARGRRDIPQIGDNEIMFMIANPGGPGDPAQFAAAREADRAGQPALSAPQAAPVEQPAPPAAPPAPAPPVALPPVVPVPPAPVAIEQPTPPTPPQLTPQPPVTGAQGAVAFSPLAAAAGQPAFSPPGGAQAPGMPPVAAAPPGMAIPAPGGSVATPPATPPAGAAPPIGGGSAQERAMAIINAENMPIPPEIDGDPPRLSNDLSKVSDDELFSFHAQFHSCEVRMNWVISQQQDALSDALKLLRDTKRQVRLDLPKEVDGKKVTKDNMEATVDNDPTVKQYQASVDELEKVMGKLKVLRDGYHQDVSTCSRQFSMRSGESDKQPR